MKARCNSTLESTCMGNIRILEPDFIYISTQKYQVLAVIFRYHFYDYTRWIFEFYENQKFYHLAHKYCNIRFYLWDKKECCSIHVFLALNCLFVDSVSCTLEYQKQICVWFRTYAAEAQGPSANPYATEAWMILDRRQNFANLYSCTRRLQCSNWYH